jgi:hypothetical protein
MQNCGWRHPWALNLAKNHICGFNKANVLFFPYLGNSGCSFKNTILFVAFDFEEDTAESEYPIPFGSQYFVRNLTQHLNRMGGTIKGALVLEMLANHNTTRGNCVFICFFSRSFCVTHVKTHKLCSRLVAMLFQQLVNRMCSHCLFPACWQVVHGLLTTCYKVAELNRLVTSCSNNLLSSCNSTICQQVVSDNLVATW